MSEHHVRQLLTILNRQTLPSFNKTELEMHKIEALWSLSAGADPGFLRGGFFYMQGCCRRQCTEVCSADQSARSPEKKNFAFIFQLSGWALMAPSCFALLVPDVKGL